MSDTEDWACDLVPLTITPPPAPAAATTRRSMAEVDAIVSRYVVDVWARGRLMEWDEAL